ncbi:MAG TPA: 2-dehydropantoate 2-reductase N-terminal domain-containing protein, partial [Lacipirellulaceae bacterium]|nr:2-dehydropantoate 2-reductase N-terminal domain-containing protein [Lacipirellulaceae bacterium]
VLGAGAVGSMFGALLKRDAPELDITLIVRGEYGRAIYERQAVIAEGPWGQCSVPLRASLDCADIAGSDIIFVTVKSHASEEAARAAKPYWPDATIVSIQNGINERLLARHADLRQLVVGMTATNIAIVEPGRVSLQLGGATIVGPPIGHASSQRVDTVTTLLRRIRCKGLHFGSSPNITGMRYNKLAINALGYASCLSASNFISEALCHPAWRKAVALPIIAECRRVFALTGIPLETIPGVPSLRRIGRLTRMMSWPVIGGAINFGARRKFDRKPIVFSLRQDLKRGKTTEVEHINGEIVRLAATVGQSAPMNAEVVRMVHELENRGAGSFFARDEVIRRFERVLAAEDQSASGRSDRKFVRPVRKSTAAAKATAEAGRS